MGQIPGDPVCLQAVHILLSDWTLDDKYYMPAKILLLYHVTQYHQSSSLCFYSSSLIIAVITYY